MKYSVMVMIAVAAAWSLASAQPKIAVEKLEYDLGTVYAGQSLTGKFPIKNLGNKPLLIQQVQPSCGCTTIKSVKPELKPGESDMVEFVFNSSGFRGQLVKYVNVTSNDSQTPYLTVRFNVNVKEELEPVNRSSMVWFGPTIVDTLREQVYELKNVTDKSIRIRKIESEDSAVVVTADKKEVRPSEVVRLSVAVKPVKVGYTNDKVIIRTDSNNQSSVLINVAYMGTRQSKP